MITWGYVRCSEIPLRTRSGSVWGRNGLFALLRSHGDRVIVFSPNKLGEFATKLGVEVTENYKSAETCDYLFIEGAETAMRMSNYVYKGQPSYVVFSTNRTAVHETLRFFGNRNVIMQVADPLTPPCIIGETGSWQYGDYPTLTFLRGKSFLSLSEALMYNEYIQGINSIRSPIDALTYATLPFPWNAALTEVYLNGFVKRDIVPFESRDIGAGYYGISKNFRWEITDNRESNPKNLGTMKQFYDGLKKRGIDLKISTRRRDFPTEWGQDCFEEHPAMDLHKFIKRLRASLIVTDGKMIKEGFITTRTAESAFFGSPMVNVPNWGASQPMLLKCLNELPLEFKTLAWDCIPKEFLTGMTNSWDEFYERIVKLQEPGFFKQEQDKLVAIPSIKAGNIYSLLVKFAISHNEPMESRERRYQEIFRRIQVRAKLRKDEGLEVHPLIEKFYLGSTLRYKRTTEEDAAYTLKTYS